MSSDDREVRSAAVPDDVRAHAAAAYEDVYPAVMDGRWEDAACAGRRVLTLLQRYPGADQHYHFRMEMAWSYFALGMQAKVAGRLREAARHLTKAADMLPEQQQPSITAEALNQLAVVQADMRHLRASAETYKRALGLFKVRPPGQELLWLGLGRVLERLGDRESRIAAIHAYSEALRGCHNRVTDEAEPWTYDAYAGIVRCCFSHAGPQERPFWVPWLQGSWFLRFCFWVLTVIATSLYIAAAIAVKHNQYDHAGWLLALSAAPALVILLPSLRRASGPGWAVELQTHQAVRLAFDLKQPTSEELPQ